jgi:Dolichyl-phosphate-mannose-protein mannosyltransferase
VLRYRDFPFLAALCVAGYFALATWPGVLTHFAPDDMQNIYTYWSRGAWSVARANLLFATSFYRPLAGLFYLPLFRLFGFNPLPYRIVIHAVLCLNVWLLYCLARCLTGSRETAAFAALIGCVHSNVTGVYASTSMIYEVLCFPFLIGALLYYVRARQNARMLSKREVAALALLFACALNAKEMAVVLPAFIVAYELIYHGLRRPSARELAPVAVTGTMAVIYVLGKLLGPETLAAMEAYRPVYTLDRFLATSRTYAGGLFLAQPFDTAHTILFWAGLIAVAAVLRRKAMLFGAAFAFIAFLPLNFVPPRDSFVLYIPLVGFAIYAADLIVAALDFVAKVGRTPSSARDPLVALLDSRRQLAALLFAACLLGLGIVHVPRTQRGAEDTLAAEDLTWRVLQQFEQVHPRVKPGSRVLLVDSPIQNDWDIYFIAKLYFRDPALKAAWIRPSKSPIAYGDVHGDFDHELRFEGERLRQVR